MHIDALCSSRRRCCCDGAALLVADRGEVCFWVPSRVTWCGASGGVCPGRVRFYWGVSSNTNLWPCLQSCVWRQAECCNKDACACGKVLRHLRVRLSSRQPQFFTHKYTKNRLPSGASEPPQALSCPSFTAMRLRPRAATTQCKPEKKTANRPMPMLPAACKG